VCCAASKANIEFLTGDNFQEGFKERCKLFEKMSNNLLKYDCITHINTEGMVTGIIFDETEKATKVVKDCIKNGVLPVCTFKNAIKLGPPLTITTDAIKESFEVIEQCIKLADE